MGSAAASSTTTCAADGPTTTTTTTTTSPRVRVIPSDRLYVSEPDPSWFGNGPNPRSNPTWTNKNWLKSRFHFSFAEYSNSKNRDFGVLRVMNDDLVQARRGFGTHPHSNMEIITYIVEGALTHQDSMGTKETLGRGSIQFMTAGTGVRHSEFNHGDQPLRFIQTWIKPSQSGLRPNYGSHRGNPNIPKNKLHHLVSNVKDKSVRTPVQVNQDVDAFASELEQDQTITFDIAKGRQGYLLCLEGSVEINGWKLQRHDGCEITTTKGGGTLNIKATTTEATSNGNVAHILLYTMQASRNAGRTDFL